MNPEATLHKLPRHIIRKWIRENWSASRGPDPLKI
jgi:hypothetical protein